MNKIFLIGTLVFFGLLLMFLVLYLILSYPAKTHLAENGSLAYNFTLEDIEGNKLALSDFKKPVLLVFWATWCKFCAEELQDLKKFTEKHREDVQVVVLPSGEVKRTVKEYIEKKEINFLMLLDETKEVWNEYGVRGTPSHFLIDKEGKIIANKPGLSTLEDLERMLLMLR